jgi:hypothetical protein
MFYMGIDQHKKHLTISVRDEQGNVVNRRHVVNRRQVSTAWTDLEGYFRDARGTDRGTVPIPSTAYLQTLPLHGEWHKGGSAAARIAFSALSASIPSFKLTPAASR